MWQISSLGSVRHCVHACSITQSCPIPWDPWDNIAAAAAAAKSLQSCPTLCDPTDSSPPGSPVPGILKARTLESVAISFSNAWKWRVKVKSLSCVRLVVTLLTVAHRASLSFISWNLLKLTSIESVMPSNHRLYLAFLLCFGIYFYILFSIWYLLFP